MMWWQCARKTITAVSLFAFGTSLTSYGVQRYGRGGSPEVNSVDSADCYFDKDCHAKVNWQAIGKVKEVFFTKLKALKNGKVVPDEQVLKMMLSRTHQLFADAGVPDDRIDFILYKWVNAVYPGTLDIKSVSGKPDCYFDEECHAKVDWDAIAKIKYGFFKRLKMMKTHTVQVPGQSLEPLLARTHKQFAEAGMPDDRIDYILGKWVDHAYPEALDTKETPNIVIQGFSCENGYGQSLNQEYVYKGVTADGRPYYKGADGRFLYYDARCSDDVTFGAWLVNNDGPSLTRTSGLDEHDRVGCYNDFLIKSESRHVPLGHIKTAWQWCGGYGQRDHYLSVGYKNLVPKQSTNAQKEVTAPKKTDAMAVSVADDVEVVV